MTYKKDGFTSNRKDDHIKACLENDVKYKTLQTGFQNFKLHPLTLVDISPDQVNAESEIFGKKIDFPLLISGMTGGSQLSQDYNRKIAKVCNEFNIGMGVGSQRAAIENSNLIETFQIRNIAPDVPLIANLGLSQFNKGYGKKEADLAVDMIGADALAIHINPLQELVQLEGDGKHSYSLDKLELLIPQLNMPVILKGVGTGFSKIDLENLAKLKPYAIDIAGAGGTNWTKIEYIRNKKLEYISDEFVEQGISTIESLNNATNTRMKSEFKIIASGGIWAGTDAVKALIMGADYVAFALPVLRTLAKGGEDELRKFMSNYILELKTSMAMLGSKNLHQLKVDKDKKIGRI